jgi:hypothetical protein
VDPQEHETTVSSNQHIAIVIETLVVQQPMLLVLYSLHHMQTLS